MNFILLLMALCISPLRLFALAIIFAFEPAECLTMKKTKPPKQKGKQNDRQINQYDKILRENLEAALPGMIKNLLHIHAVHTEELPGDEDPGLIIKDIVKQLITSSRRREKES